MYKQIKTDPIAILGNDNSGDCNFSPIATLADEYGGRCQISIDDLCYVLRLKQADGKYKTTSYIFSEAFEVLKTLPSPMKGETTNDIESYSNEFLVSMICGIGRGTNPWISIEALRAEILSRFKKKEKP